ncbi:MAG: hypothetical protein HRT45_05770 [Bdellovibrionales bacterium]|nr:hypothetical protein [Bdellovibrionales bacterium]
MSEKNITVTVSTFYLFKPLSESFVEDLKTRLEALSEREASLCGLILLGSEGINSTVAGSKEAVTKLKQLVSLELDDKIWFKDSECEFLPFSRFKVKIKSEIVTLGRPDLVPSETVNHHLSPDEWDKALQEEDVVCIDTRNTYETDIGIFKGALDFRIDDFQEFTAKMKDSGIDKDKKILIYCTGGIRCEKAILELQELGYNNVHQLNGGIINYLAEKPNSMWEGECFVFDHRVALDQNLNPSKQYFLCPHCGQPGTKKIECRQCGTEQVVCDTCLELGPEKETCSKNCANHYKLGNKSTRIHKDSFSQRAKKALSASAT